MEIFAKEVEVKTITLNTLLDMHVMSIAIGTPAMSE